MKIYHLSQRKSFNCLITHTLYLLLILSAFLKVTPAICQGNELPVIKKLTIADFKGPPDESVDYLAQTTPSISLRYSSPINCPEAGKVKVRVQTGISISEKSWIKSSKIKTPELLNALLSHEQGHYDMGAIFSLELKKTLSGLCFDKTGYRQQVDSVFKAMYARYDLLQRAYDSDTDHMRNKAMQFKWKQRIAAMWKDKL